MLDEIQESLGITIILYSGYVTILTLETLNMKFLS